MTSSDLRRPRRLRRLRRLHGFTLIEGIIAIVLTGIVASVVAVFITKPIEGYVDTVRRAEMTNAADTAIRRMARDVRSALPNSLRAPSNQCLEFVPIVASGRYRNALDNGGGGNVFDFSTTGAFSFDALGGVGLTSALTAETHHVVVFNLGVGIDGSDVYAGQNRRAITALNLAGSFPVVSLGASPPTSPSRFRFESPGRRFHVIPDYTVQYSCTGGTTGSIIRTTQGIASGNACPHGAPTSTSVLATNVDCTNTAFNYTPGAMQRDGLLNVTVRLTKSGESIQLFNEIHVNNVP